MIAIDLAWRRDHPLPSSEGTSKNTRGQVLLVGGSERVPGALQLTGEAALRTGAGKLQVATAGAAAIPLGIAMPEVAVIALAASAKGEIDRSAGEVLARSVERCDTLILGPAMSEGDDVPQLVMRMVEALRPDQALLLDAAAVSCAGDLAAILRGHAGPLVMTPHHGEAARLTGQSVEAIAADAPTTATGIARQFGAVVVLKADRTVIATPDGTLLDHHSETPGLAIPGSGDVLAGIIGALLARGAEPLVASGWGVWLHEAAGRMAAGQIGPIGFLAREILPQIPRLLAR